MSYKVLFAAVALSVFAFTGVTRLAAQGTTATILGTVTDATGAVIAGANVEVKNTGTGQTQTVQSDAQGRYRVPDLIIGDYQVQVSKAGFSTVVHKGITLSVGSQNVVDFSLAVGQTQQAVTVEGQVTQVETTDAAIATLVDQTQMRELPLNGRDFEQLIQLAPGVQNYYAGQTGSNMREGRDPAISIAGGRPEGTALLMDDQSLETFYNRGLGSITGSSLGVDAIAEFQTPHQYLWRAVWRVGSGDEFGEQIRHRRFPRLAFTNFCATAPWMRGTSPIPSHVPEFRRNQFGGTIGGPIKKDKLFFFANYEGVQLVQGFSQIVTVRRSCRTTRVLPPQRNPQTAAAVNAVMALFQLPTFNFNTGRPGTGQTTVVAVRPRTKTTYLGRVDYNISDKDSFFARYFDDLQYAVYPFSGSNLGSGAGGRKWRQPVLHHGRDGTFFLRPS